MDGTTDAQCVLSLRNGQYLSSSCTLRSFAMEDISSLMVAEELPVGYGIGHGE